jgi:hypothetical protein
MRITALALIVSLVAIGATTAQAQQDEAAAWRQVAESIPLGAKVKVQMANGSRVNGTLMRVDGGAIMLKRNTRRPEPALVVPFNEVARLERDKPGGGMHIAKAVGVGLAAGAGVFVSMLLVVLQFD